MDLHGRGVREDVRELGESLGEAVRSHEQAATYQAVESARTAAIDYRRGDGDDRATLRDLVERADPGDCENLARAFTGYFELVNLAEERERVRELRRNEAAGTLSDGIRGAVADLADADATGADVANVLADVRV
ncbi:phosphoenolpyruvate carboxylase, partial [Halobacterium bonnevillei]